MLRIVATLLLAVFSSVAFAQSTPTVTIKQISFTNTPGLSRGILNDVASEVEQKQWDLVSVLSCISEQVRDALQERGYFKAAVERVNMKPEVTAGHVSAVITANPGPQYRVGEIEFSGKPIFTARELQTIVTARGGSVFNLRELRRMLENLRNYYASRGYNNLSIVPDTMIDEDKRLISITLDVDPGS